MSRKGQQFFMVVLIACGGAATVTELLPTVWAADGPHTATEQVLARMSVPGIDQPPPSFGPVQALTPAAKQMALRREFGPYGPLMSNPEPQAPALPADGGNVQFSRLDL